MRIEEASVSRREQLAAVDASLDPDERGRLVAPSGENLVEIHQRAGGGQPKAVVEIGRRRKPLVEADTTVDLRPDQERVEVRRLLDEHPADGSVADGRGPQWMRIANDAAVRDRPHEVGDRSRRAVVDDDRLVVSVGLALDGLERAEEQVVPVTRGNDHGDERRGIHGVGLARHLAA
jgi:hypothetical protein